MIIKVTCAIIVENNKILTAKRSSSMPHSGFWEFPGGKIEEGESSENCLMREIKEELNCEIHIHKKLPAFTHQHLDKHIELQPYVCSIANGTPQPLEHSEIRWLNTSELLYLNWLPADIAIAKFLKSFNEKSFY